MDLELNPSKIQLGQGGPQLSLRKRWELRWKEGRGSEVFHRLRQYSRLAWKIDAGPFSAYTIGNEVFYETDMSRITTNRFYPIMLDAPIGDSVKSTVFLLYQSKRAGSTGNWSGEYILGLGMDF